MDMHWPDRRAGGAAASPAPVRARRLQEAEPDRVATMRAPPPPPSPGRRTGGAATNPVRAHRLREAGPDPGPPPPPSSTPPFRRPWPGRQAGRAASPRPIRARRLAPLLDWTLFCIMMSCSASGKATVFLFPSPQMRRQPAPVVGGAGSGSVVAPGRQGVVAPGRQRCRHGPPRRRRRAGPDQ